jgi:diguanylate cyclase (GGDEF)-like protein
MTNLVATIGTDPFAVLDAMADAILVVDENFAIRRANPPACRLFAADETALIATNLVALLPDAKNAASKWHAANGIAFEMQALACDGRVFPARLTVGRYAAQSEPFYIVGVGDLSDQRALEGQLRAHALRDALTGLATRALFIEQIDSALMRRQAQAANQLAGGILAVACLGIDRFKAVNDSLGYSTGDELLRQVGARLTSELGPQTVLARIGGDEFGLLIDGVAREADAAVLVERALGLFAQSFALAGRNLPTSASLGLAFAANGAAPDTPENLLSNADVAMLRAKRTGGGRIEIFEPGRHGEALGKLELELALRAALACDEFDVLYQPIVDVTHGDLRGVEALIRWNRGGVTPVPPAVFIPIAEESGLIVEIGEWILYRACKQMVDWRKRFAAAAPDYVSVNLSARQLDRDDVPALVRRVLAETGLPARHLELELTESAVVQNADAGRDVLREVVALGVALSIDDFGTGQSSLSQLPRLPISKIKIDRAFVGRMDSESECFEIVRIIVGLANALGMGTVAEGIERDGQAQLLRQLGCRHGQGYFFHRPLAVPEIDALCAKGAAPESALRFSA